MAQKQEMMPLRSEDELGRKWDRCLSDTSIKFASGVGLGIVFSVIFFKRRPWPVAFGAGVGLGMGYSNCQHDFMHPNYFHGAIQKKAEKMESKKEESKTESKKDEKKE